MNLYSQHLKPGLVKTTLNFHQNHSEIVLDPTAFTLLDGKRANVTVPKHAGKNPVTFLQFLR